MNFLLLERKLEDKEDNSNDSTDFDIFINIFIRVLYKGLLNKSINPLIDENLYRESIIKKEELEYIKDFLNKKKEGLPGCICYNKAFFSSSLDINAALKFMNKKINDNEFEHVLYI